MIQTQIEGVKKNEPRDIFRRAFGHYRNSRSFLLGRQASTKDVKVTHIKLKLDISFEQSLFGHMPMAAPNNLRAIDRFNLRTSNRANMSQSFAKVNAYAETSWIAVWYICRSSNNPGGGGVNNV